MNMTRRNISGRSGRKPGRPERRLAGRLERRPAETDHLRELIRKKLAKGKTIPEIAEALEEDEDVIRRLIDESNQG